MLRLCELKVKKRRTCIIVPLRNVVGHPFQSLQHEGQSKVVDITIPRYVRHEHALKMGHFNAPIVYTKKSFSSPIFY